jgi:hypothetical protein
VRVMLGVSVESGYVLILGGLVNARRLLCQSKPSIKILDVNTALGRCKPSADDAVPRAEHCQLMRHGRSMARSSVPT